jgi:hypothetical protein
MAENLVTCRFSKMLLSVRLNPVSVSVQQELRLTALCASFWRTNLPIDDQVSGHSNDGGFSIDCVFVDCAAGCISVDCNAS